jgi:Bardet-Biedl syndrome 7 protein
MSISTIAILKEVISKEATARKLTLDMNVQIRAKETLPRLLTSIRPKLDSAQRLASQMKIIDGIQELKMHEGTDYTLWMDREYQTILENSDNIQEEFKMRPQAMNYLAGVLTDLYADACKCRGVNVCVSRYIIDRSLSLSFD